MDVKSFVEELLHALAQSDIFGSVSLQSEGPVVNGYAFIREREECFLRFYFNEATGTTAFALIEHNRRIWGIDFDNRRGWHMHPLEDPTQHLPIAPQSIEDIVRQLTNAWSGKSW